MHEHMATLWSQSKPKKMEGRLYEATLSGNAQTLNTLIKEDPLILDRVTVTCFDETLLHISALRGHLDFTRAILSLKPKLATELDSLGRSPLHLASAEGYTNIVRELLRATTDVCLVRDHEGRIPLHLAAMKGRVEVIDELVRARPESIVERLDRGETVLHLCVRYNRLEALKLLIELMRDHHQFLLYARDDDGNTILHVAAALKQIETIKFLLSRMGSITKMAHASNGNGFTALDVLEHCPRDLKWMEIRQILHEAGVPRAKDHRVVSSKRPPPLAEIENPTFASSGFPQFYNVAQKKVSKLWRSYVIQDDNGWLEDVRGNLMVVATLIATMAFQAGVNPPWKDNTIIEAKKGVAGQFTLFFNYSDPRARFLAYNTVSYIASLTVILIMVSGIPLKNKLSMWLMVAAMCLTVSFMAFTYMASLDIIASEKSWERVDEIFTGSLGTCVSVFLFVVFVHTARLSSWVVYKLIKFVPRRKWSTASPATETVMPAV